MNKKKKTPEKITMFVVDQHIPFIDPRVDEITRRVAEKLQPDTVIMGGDVIDWYDLSVFNKNPYERMHEDSANNASDDAILAAKYLKSWKELCKTMIFLEGNHESRLKYFADRHNDVLTKIGLKEFTVPDLLRFKWAGVDKYIPAKPGDWGDDTTSKYWIVKKKFRAMHGWNYGIYASRNMLLQQMTSGVQGHSHRSKEFTHTKGCGEVVGWYEVGCQCLKQPGYKDSANWQNGFAIISQYNGNIDVQNVEVRDNKCRVDGHWFNEKGAM